MTLKEEIVALQDRIAKAESERDTWRSSGMQENYLEAYSRVEALELQLEGLRQQGLRAFVRPEPAASVLAAAPDAAGERERLMAELAITFQDGVYRLGEYRYDRLADAANYARLRRLHVRRP